MRPSRSTFDAALAAADEVCFFGAATCDNALPDEALDIMPVALLWSVLDAAVAALLPVVFVFAMTNSPI